MHARVARHGKALPVNLITLWYFQGLGTAWRGVAPAAWHNTAPWLGSATKSRFGISKDRSKSFKKHYNVRCLGIFVHAAGYLFFIVARGPGDEAGPRRGILNHGIGGRGGVRRGQGVSAPLKFIVFFLANQGRRGLEIRRPACGGASFVHPTIGLNV